MLYLVFILLIGVAISVIWAFKSLAPWVPTRTRDLARILRLAQILPEETFYDLGCGTGKVAFYMAKRTHAKIIGIELAIPFYLICKFLDIFKPGQTIFKNKSLFSENLSDANVVYIFGLPDKLKAELKDKLEQELKPGTRVITYCFPIEGWQPTQIDKPDEKSLKIFLYQR